MLSTSLRRTGRAESVELARGAFSTLGGVRSLFSGGAGSKGGADVKDHECSHPTGTSVSRVSGVSRPSELPAFSRASSAGVVSD